MHFNRQCHVLKPSTNGGIQINETTESCVLNRQSTMKCNFVKRKHVELSLNSYIHTGALYHPEGKVYTRTGYEGPYGEKRYSSALSLTSALDGWVVNATLRPLYPRKRPGTHCIGGWVGPRAGLDRCGKSRPHRDSIPGPSSP